MAYLQFKDEFVNIFHIWLPTIEVPCGKSIQILCTDGRKNLFLLSLKSYVTRKISG